jgi:hypothetical protein
MMTDPVVVGARRLFLCRSIPVLSIQLDPSALDLISGALFFILTRSSSLRPSSSRA